MIVSLLLTSTGELILLFALSAIIGYCIWINQLVWWDRAELFLLIRRKTDPLWIWKLSFLESDSYKRHLVARLFWRDWKEVYRPGFFVDEDMLPRDEP